MTVAPYSLADDLALFPPDAPELRIVAESLGPLRLRYAPITPTPKQEAFLRCMRREAFYGGSAGPGKSTALLAAALQFADVPGYAAILFRRTSPELRMPGGLEPKAMEWLAGHASWSAMDSRWTFPSTATLTFGHMQYDVDRLRYQSAEFQFVGFDELTTFSEAQYRYMFSRVRRPSQPPAAGAPDGMTLDRVPLRVRGASNPGGPGHDWVKDRLVSDARGANEITGDVPVLVPALARENPHLDVASYRANLAALHPVDRQRLEDGDWDVSLRGRLGIDSGSFIYVDEPPPAVRAVRHWDLAGSEASPEYPDPDYSAGLRYELAADGLFTVTALDVFRCDPGETERRVAATAQRDGRAVRVSIEQEPGQSGKAQVAHYARDVLAGYAVTGRTASGDKLTRAMIPAAAAGNRLVRVVRAAWTETFVDVVSRFPNVAHDDVVDAWSGAHESLTRGSRVSAASAADVRL